MKIGILTITIMTGYGSILQALALKTALQLRGHEVVFINRHTKVTKNIYSPIRIARRTVKKLFFDRHTIILIAKKERDEYPVVSQYIQPFIDKYLSPFTERIYSRREFRKVNTLGLDAIVVGSDQVWRPGFVDDVRDYFLENISDGIRKYAYGASFGVDTWEYNRTQGEICRRLLKSFRRVSVREMSGVALCEKHLGCHPELVLDPTLLFDSAFYRGFITEHDDKKDRKLCTYILDDTEEKADVVRKYAQLLGVEILPSQTKTEDRSAPVEERIAPSISSWLDSFCSAEAVCTDSFHGMVFSIIFRKPFLVICNKERGAARFYSLLRVLKLEHRMVDSTVDLSVLPPIDWDMVSIELSKMQSVSNDFLNSIK